MYLSSPDESEEPGPGIEFILWLGRETGRHTPRPLAVRKYRALEDVSGSVRRLATQESAPETVRVLETRLGLLPHPEAPSGALILEDVRNVRYQKSFTRLWRMHRGEIENKKVRDEEDTAKALGVVG